MYTLIAIYTLYEMKHQYDLSALDLYIHPNQTKLKTIASLTIPIHTFIRKTYNKMKNEFCRLRMARKLTMALDILKSE